MDTTYVETSIYSYQNTDEMSVYDIDVDINGPPVHAVDERHSVERMCMVIGLLRLRRCSYRRYRQTSGI